MTAFRTQCVLSLLIGALSHTPIQAHQMQVAITTVSIKPGAQSIEVIHRFYTHDTEHVMSVLAQDQVDLVSDQDVQNQFGRYIGQHFQLLESKATELPLTLVGVELDGDFVWVYQEVAIPAALSLLAVRNTALLDVLPDQVNTVNVECDKQVSTLNFVAGSGVLFSDIDFTSCFELGKHQQQETHFD